jgi:hypothetical protein
MKLLQLTNQENATQLVEALNTFASYKEAEEALNSLKKQAEEARKLILEQLPLLDATLTLPKLEVFLDDVKSAKAFMIEASSSRTTFLTAEDIEKEIKKAKQLKVGDIKSNPRVTFKVSRVEKNLDKPFVESTQLAPQEVSPATEVSIQTEVLATNS